MRRLARPEVLLLAAVLAVGTAGLAVGLRRHAGDPAFAFRQHNPQHLESGAVERLVRTAREPLPTGPGRPGTRARCRPTAGRPLGNPWTCTVDYPSGNRIRYGLIVFRNGSIAGSAANRVINGCCVPTP
jgi:hypothetical protein